MHVLKFITPIISYHFITVVHFIYVALIHIFLEINVTGNPTQTTLRHFKTCLFSHQEVRTSKIDKNSGTFFYSLLFPCQKSKFS